MKDNTAVICLSTSNGGMELASLKIASLLSTSVNSFIIARENSFIATSAAKFKVIKETVCLSNHFSLLLIYQIRKILKEKKVKNIIFLGASELKSLYFSCLGLDINLIVRQGTYKKTPKKDFFHKVLYSNVRYFIANSSYILESVKHVIPLARKTELKTIYASYDTPKKLEVSVPQTTIKIIHSGRIVEGKGQLDVLRACLELKKKNILFQCDFFGSIEDSNYYTEMENYIVKNKLSGNVLFHGYVTDMESILNTSDIFLFPTRGEGFSNSVIEAIAHGLVVITYENSSMPEIQSQGFYIHLTKDLDNNGLSEQLLKSTQDIFTEKEKAFKNILLAQEVFSLQKEREGYLSLLV